MSRAIFLGGSLHKTDRYIAVKKDMHVLEIPIEPDFTKTSPSVYWSTDLFRTERYLKDRINIFGLTLEVWVEAGSRDRMWALCVDALLSDYAKDGDWS